MNILFLTMSKMITVNQRGIYTDLMRKFRNEGHQVYIVSPSERRDKQPTRVIESDGVHILSVKTLNVQKTNVIEKGLGQVSLEFLYKHAVKKYFAKVKFDLILYSTPPITITKVIEAIKRNNPQAICYLLLKDIFPQNAVDLGIIKNKGLLHSIFRQKEKRLYQLSDYIGCMSPANVQYLLNHNVGIPQENVEVNPNSIELSKTYLSQEEKNLILEEYNLPKDKTILVYGGNLGKPQGIDFLLEVINSNSNNLKAFFLIIGSGTEYNRINSWFIENKPKNARLIPGLPKEKYDKVVQSCNVGLIFLDRRFTIPNFPSRLLSYLEYGIPIIAATDANTDIGKIAEKNGFGFSVLNGDLNTINKVINELVNNRIQIHNMGKKGIDFLVKNYLVDISYKLIIKRTLSNLQL